VQLNFEVVMRTTLLQSALEICQAEIDLQTSGAFSQPRRQKNAHASRPARLQQIFWNLINNAVKLRLLMGKLRLPPTMIPRDNCMLRSPIPVSALNRKRCQKSSMPSNKGGRTQLGGLGLGLAISKTLVEAHEGTITAQSAGRNGGSTFTLVFPTAKRRKRNRPGRFAQGAERQPCGFCLSRSRGYQPLAYKSAPAARLSSAISLNFQSALI